MQQYSWLEIYRLALTEVDSSKVSERIALAREKLKQRMQMAGLDAAEKRAIMDALDTLYTLYAIESNEQSRSRSAREA